MKFKILISFFLLLSSFGYGQFVKQSLGGSPGTDLAAKGVVGGDSSIYVTEYADTTAANGGPNVKKKNGILIKVGSTIYMRDVPTNSWVSQAGGNGTLIPGGPITTIPVVGTNPGVNLTWPDFIKNAFYGAQPPIAVLTGGGIFEYTTGSTVSRNLNWSASRQTATTNLSSIVVGGITQAFSNPAAPGTVSGVQVMAVPVNTNTTYSNVVTASNSMTSTATTTFTYKRKIFAGFVSSATPSDADIMAATGSIYVGGTLSDTRIQTGALSTPASSSYIMFASPASFGVPTVVVNGLTVAFSQITRSFININGYASSYYIMISPYQTAGAVDVYSIQ